MQYQIFYRNAINMIEVVEIVVPGEEYDEDHKIFYNE